MEENMFDMFSKLENDRLATEKRALENPELFLNEMGIDPTKMNIQELAKIVENFKQNEDGLIDIFKNKNFTDLKRYQNKPKDGEFTDIEKEKLKNLTVIAIKKSIGEQERFCFIDDSQCNCNIAKAHGVQENGQLSLIADKIKGKMQVLHLVQNNINGKKELQEIDIASASTFWGFCENHDNRIFEPIDKKSYNTDLERFFLYSFRSFAFSYYNIKSYQTYHLKNIESSISNIHSSLNLANGILDKLKSNLLTPNNSEIPTIDAEVTDNLELLRFEKHRGYIIQYLKDKAYSQLDYITYEISHLCPIACVSWLTMRIDFGNGFMISTGQIKPYYGFPIILSLLPVEDQKSILVLARFKNDSRSELIFNHFNNLKSNQETFEREVSKLIIENAENFYLSPKFWNSLRSDEKELIIKAINVEKKQFSEEQTVFEMINFFDRKYSLSQS